MIGKSEREYGRDRELDLKGEEEAGTVTGAGAVAVAKRAAVARASAGRGKIVEAEAAAKPAVGAREAPEEDECKEKNCARAGKVVGVRLEEVGRVKIPEALRESGEKENEDEQEEEVLALLANEYMAAVCSAEC